MGSITTMSICDTVGVPSVPVVLVCQVNRAASKSSEKLTLNDIRDSGAIENDAAAVLMIDRIEQPTQDWRAGECVLGMELSVTKNRYGRCTPKDEPIKLVWHPAICRIEEPAGTLKAVTE